MEERATIARAHLAERHLSLDDIAERLGYGEQTSLGPRFNR